YTLTAAGEALLDRWLAAPVYRLREVRLDFLLKAFFAQRRGLAPVRALVDAQIAACESYLASLAATTAELAPDGFAALVAGSHISAAHGTLAWLREYRRQLEAAPAAAPPREGSA
ncbi:MAG: hypothetical protein EXR65_04645, partial [Dehalococcoidia bacterium]|nr:hypothetical protein [Dehalococcoidia bacterium]